MVTETQFLRFWRALVGSCRDNGLPEPTVGAASRAFALAGLASGQASLPALSPSTAWQVVDFRTAEVAL